MPWGNKVRHPVVRPGMEITYWIVAGLLAALYLFGGTKKLVQSKEALEPMMGWVDTVPMTGVRLIGLVEVLGAVGLVLPPLTDVAPGLAIAAAVGFAVLQVLAAGLHASRREFADLPMNVVLVVLAVVAAWAGTTFV